MFATELSRKGPGLLLRDILKGEDAQVAAVAAVIARANPDVLLLTGVDWDHGGATLSALADVLAQHTAPYPHHYGPKPNTGMPTGLDLDGDGRTWRARDAQGWGLFTGQGGLALLSRFPLQRGEAMDYTALLWKDAPDAELPRAADGSAFYSAEARAVQRLSTTGHWTIPLHLPSGSRLTVMAFAATPPVFDGPEDRNGLRNAAEILIWPHILDGALGPAPTPPFVLLGTANLDPVDGEGRHAAIRALLADPRLQDPAPRGAGPPSDPTHRGPHALDTADWPEDGPGNLRVDYVLPSAGIEVLDAGILWSPAGTPEAEQEQAASRHRLVWVDLDL